MFDKVQYICVSLLCTCDISVASDVDYFLNLWIRIQTHVLWPYLKNIQWNKLFLSHKSLN
jgi:hypothetical protein